MPEPFNPYQSWLGWNGSAQPNFFQLLGIGEEEDDPKVISAAADRAASRVRQFRPGEQLAAWAALLDELAEAKQRLLDPSARREYRDSLRSTGSSASASRPAAAKRPVPAPATNVNPHLFPPGYGGEPSAAGSPRIPAARPVEAAPPPSAVESDAAADSPAYVQPSATLHPMAPNPSAGYQIPSGIPAGNSPYLPAYPSAPSPVDPMAPSPAFAHPMALPFDPASPMAPLPLAADPMAPQPAYAIPASPAAPPASVATPLASPLATGLSPAMSPAVDNWSQPEEPSFANRARAAELAARHERNQMVRSILIGGTLGLLLLVMVAGTYYWFQQHGDELAEASDPERAASPTASRPDANLPANVAPVAASPAPAEPAESPPAKSTPRTPERKPDSQPSTKPDPQRAPKPEPKPEPKPDPKPESKPEPKPDPKPEPKPASNPNPKPDPKPEPEPKPESMPKGGDALEGVPKPTPADLTKLGRALTKAREAIGEHDFEKASAFLDLAGDMPRLPEHQAMIDRLHVLADSVQKYREAIQASINKLESGSSFEVGSANVGVVETGVDKVIFRVAGQNRTYTIREMPVGLAAALAAQSISPDDPNTLTLKGAFVLASPKASDEDLKKAREFLEKGAGSVDAAKDLLLLLKDSYSLK